MFLDIVGLHVGFRRNILLPIDRYKYVGPMTANRPITLQRTSVNHLDRETISLFSSLLSLGFPVDTE